MGTTTFIARALLLKRKRSWCARASVVRGSHLCAKPSISAAQLNANTITDMLQHKMLVQHLIEVTHALAKPLQNLGS
jgi:hypothetical protein